MSVSWNEQWWVSEAMQQYGGSFVKALGAALRLADPDNALRIKQAFGEYWNGYKQYAEAIKREEAAQYDQTAPVSCVSD